MLSLKVLRIIYYSEQRDHIMRQVVAYKRLKITKNYKTVKQKSGRGRLW